MGGTPRPTHGAAVLSARGNWIAARCNSEPSNANSNVKLVTMRFGKFKQRVDVLSRLVGIQVPRCCWVTTRRLQMVGVAAVAAVMQLQLQLVAHSSATPVPRRQEPAVRQRARAPVRPPLATPVLPVLQMMLPLALPALPTLLLVLVQRLGLPLALLALVLLMLMLLLPPQLSTRRLVLLHLLHLLRLSHPHALQLPRLVAVPRRRR